MEECYLDLGLSMKESWSARPLVHSYARSFVSLSVKEMTKMRGEMADCCIWYGDLVYLEGSEAKYWILLGSLCERVRSLGLLGEKGRPSCVSQILLA